MFLYYWVLFATRIFQTVWISDLFRLIFEIPLPFMTTIVYMNPTEIKPWLIWKYMCIYRLYQMSYCLFPDLVWFLSTFIIWMLLLHCNQYNFLYLNMFTYTHIFFHVALFIKVEEDGSRLNTAILACKNGKKEKLNFVKPLSPNPYGEEMEIWIISKKCFLE